MRLRGANRSWRHGGLASTQRAGAVGLAIVALLAKACGVGCVVAVIDNSFAMLRLFKITEFVSGAFLLGPAPPPRSALTSAADPCAPARGTWGC